MTAPFEKHHFAEPTIHINDWFRFVLPEARRDAKEAVTVVIVVDGREYSNVNLWTAPK